MFLIRLLGQPRIELDGQPLTIRRRKSRALVYYLAAHGHPRTRDHLLGTFWPGLDRAAAQYPGAAIDPIYTAHLDFELGSIVARHPHQSMPTPNNLDLSESGNSAKILIEG